MSIRNGMAPARPLWVLAALLAVFALVPAMAQSSVDQLRSEAEASPEDPRGWVALGNALLDEEDADGAKDAFLEAVALEYAHCDAHYGLGLAEYDRGDYQAALFAFNEVTRLCSDRFDGHYNRGVTLSQLRRPADAAEAFREAVAQAEPEASSEDRVMAWVGLAGQLKRTESYAEAADAYDSALTIRPTDDELIYLRAEALWRAGEGLEALPELTDLEGRTRDYRVSSLIADIYVDEGQVDRALRSLDRALRQAREADNDEAVASLQVKLGLLQRSLGRDADAADSFRRAVEAHPDSWEAQYNLGVSLLEAGQLQDALSALETAESLRPESGEVALALASGYDQAGRPEDAFRAAQRAATSLSDSESVTEARFIAGRSAYRLGDYGQARELLERVVDARGDDAAAQLWAGLAAYQQEAYAAAISYYQRAVQLRPDDPTARVNLGAAYLASERYEDAEKVYQLLVDQDPQDAESLYNLGWSLIGQGDRTPTREAWASSCDLGYRAACDALSQYF
ncbi:MAG: tetratricopeptide repeat protein [Trueperaceae bacterium]|nr:tetratricopeptide repeat protein [Trueperaceae bacterium]